MKKLLVMLAIAGTLVACNNSSDVTTTNTEDSLRLDSLRRDSIARASSVPSTPIDTSNKAGTDTSGKKKDTSATR